MAECSHVETIEADFNDHADIVDELSTLPGKYSPSNGGAVFLAYNKGEDPSEEPGEPLFFGCAALRAFDAPYTCEIKRLYIKPNHRRLGAGRMLLERVIEQAKRLGYKEMLLDTLPSMTAARKMYVEYGFEECEKYYDSPIEGTVFMKLKLT
ncbi:acyl-CoA N-acyltransferase [Pleomassaria siparia CBS 279.74]|uniref:Acyl-CoA N-acyltransferase n=1 Tax=Pleomassaria siparia CBS 279.74 TaxID=1314801 RepID=A0A6G1KKR2_9PLEO|nr:acyl-CoA N-acyltransferase [Pleomassaria siparia CBS 279.74]